ncbi:MAG: AbrB/MazE/SpoVT family DNA-binding domain-containing protein [Gammaproteobacteria bacterium]
MPVLLRGLWKSLFSSASWNTLESMITTVRQKNMVVIPVDIARRLGIQPGSQLDWQPVEGKDEIVVRMIPRRGERARRLLGAGRWFSPQRDSVAELVAEREAEGRSDRGG